MADSLDERAYVYGVACTLRRALKGTELNSADLSDAFTAGYRACAEDAARVAEGIQSVSEENRRTFALVGGVVARHIRALVGKSAAD